MVVVVGPGVARVVAGVDLGGCRSLGELGAEATSGEAARAGHLRALRRVGRKLARRPDRWMAGNSSAASTGGGACGEHGAVATMHEGENGEGDEEKQLMAESKVALASSGRGW